MEMSAPLGPMATVPSTNTNGGNVHASASTSGESLPVAVSGYTPEDAARLVNLKFLNATSFLLTGMVVTGVVLFKAREEGVFGDQFLWMKYQTLVTAPPYVSWLWLPIFLLQGLFVYASTLHASLQNSPLVGYDRALSSSSNYSPGTSVAVHYPAVCAMTLAMIHSHDHEHVLFAFLASLLCGVALGSILRIQGDVLNAMEADDETSGAQVDTRSRAVQYAALRLPFELQGGYVLALAGQYFNAFLGGFEGLPTIVFLVVANVTLVALLAAGFYVLWRTDRKSYGVGVALVWYLLGVAIELHAPTQPIYNEFSDAAILATQVVAGVATLVLATLLGIRAMKTAIKHNVLGCVEALDGDRSVASGAEGGITMGYVHA